jgi:hypothetical protein
VTEPAPPWRRHRIPEIGLSFDVNPVWALDELPMDDGTIVSQRLPDDSVVFVRYGRGQTLDRFLAGLGDMLTTATIVGDESVRFAGVPARRVTVRLDRRAIPVASSERPMLLRVTGLAVQSVPVLVGYRMREDQDPEIQTMLERVVGSIGVDDET